MQDYGRDPQYADAWIAAMREQKLAVRRREKLLLIKSE